MNVFDINNKPINQGYDIFGKLIPSFFDINGNEFTNISWDGLSNNVKNMLNSAMKYCSDYINNNTQSYAFPLITDAHQHFTGKEPEYIEYYYPNTWSRLLFLGDMCNAYDTTQLDNAKAFMSSTSFNKIITVGNHELGNWAEGQKLPEEWYRPLLDSSSVLWNGGDGLIYYSDDEVNNIRYIVLDSCTPIYKSAGVQKFTKNQLEWCASVMESAGNKDIIICNHTIGSSFYLVTDTNKENSISDTTVTNSGTLNSLINAFSNKSEYNITDDSGVSHSHNYSMNNGKFIGYFSGHTHQAGYTDANGFNRFTAPMLRKPYSGLPQGMSFFIIDRKLNKIIWLICDYSKDTYDKYEYTY